MFRSGEFQHSVWTPCLKYRIVSSWNHVDGLSAKGEPLTTFFREGLSVARSDRIDCDTLRTQ